MTVSVLGVTPVLDRTLATNPSRIIGIYLEGPFLNPLKCGALGARTFIEPSEKNLQKLLEGFENIIKIITIAPEIKGASKLIKKISDMGIIVSMGHSEATFSDAEAGFHAGAKGITHIFNAMRSFHHREPGIAGFGLINKDIYIEVIADPFHLHPETLALIFKIKNPQKIIIVSDTVKETPSPVRLLSSASRLRRPSREGMKGKDRSISDTKGKLLGGSMTIVESAERFLRTKSEHEGLVLVTAEGEFKLLRKGGNPFWDETLAALEGKEIDAASTLRETRFTISHWKVLP